MKKLESVPTPKPKTMLFSFPQGWDANFLVWIIFSIICLYGYELFDFTLSIDEEIFQFATKKEIFIIWLGLGRWSMALMAVLLPPISAMPFLSTMIFCIGLVFSALNIASLLKLDREKSIYFCVIFMASPIWPHLAEFNVLSFGVGAGLIVVSIGARLLVEGKYFWLPVLAFTFAIGIYQTFSVFIGLLLLFLLVTQKNGYSEQVTNAAIKRVGLAFLFGVLGYFVVKLTVNALFLTTESGYVSGLIRSHESLSDVIEAFRKSVSSVVRLLFVGTHQIYLGWGLLITGLSFLGTVAYLKEVKKSRINMALLFLVVMVLCLPLLAAGVPARGLIYVPLAASFLGCFATNKLNFWGGRIWLAGILFICSYISNQLFYWDYLARLQDQQVAMSLSVRLDLLRKNEKEEIPFAIVGSLKPQFPVQQKEVFGNSYLDEGYSDRLVNFMKIIGVRNIVAVETKSISVEQMRQIDLMPVWPAKGSIDWVGSIVVAKFGEMGNYQRKNWCLAHEDDQKNCDEFKNKP